MKKGFNILLILCAALVAISCSKTKSYTDMLKDEKKAIERLIDANDFEILDDFPKDSIFKDCRMAWTEQQRNVGHFYAGTGSEI